MKSENESIKLTSAMEDYLEAIYHLEQERRIARVRDIAQKLKVRMSSVSAALKILGSRDLIKYDPHQFITLTDIGLVRAKEIVRKHEILKSFLNKILKIEESVAEDNACRIEHHLDPEVIEKLVHFVKMVEHCPVETLRRFEEETRTCQNCEPCLEEARKKLSTRNKAQKTAVESGLTLSEAAQGDQLLVQSVTGSAELRKRLADDGLEKGAILTIESVDSVNSHFKVNINGYHILLPKRDATNILVKPL